SAPPLLKSYCPELAEALLALVHRMLAKAPHERPTMAAIAEQLATDLTARPRQVQTADEPRSSSTPVEGVSLAQRLGATGGRPRSARWLRLGLGGLLPLLLGRDLLLRPRPPHQTATNVSVAAPPLLRPPVAAPSVASPVAPPVAPPAAA